MKTALIRVVVAGAILSLPTVAGADGPLPTDELVSIDSELAVSFRRDSETVSFPREAIDRWGTLGELRGRETVILTDGSLLAGSVATLDDAGIDFSHDVFDPLRIPRSAVRGVIIRRPAAQLAFDKMVIRLASESFEQDTLLLKNGDTISGSLLERAADGGETISIEVAGNKIEVPLASIAAVAFRTKGAGSTEAGRLRLGLRKGDLLEVESIITASRLVKVRIKAGIELATPPDFLWPDVTYLAAHASASTSVADLPPLSYRHLPQLGWETPLGRNTNVIGGRLRAGGRIFPTGLGMPGSSRVAYRLDGSYQKLAADVAIDDSAGNRGSVSFRVYGRKGEGDLQALFTSQVIRGGESPVPIEVDVEGVTLLVLLVDHADRSDELDYANWLNVRLIR